MTTLNELRPGDRVSIPKAIFLRHSMIHVGAGRFVEKAPTGQVRLRLARDLPLSLGFRVVTRPHPSLAPAVVARALARLGWERYDVFADNCEHFANEVLTGERRSEQVEGFAFCVKVAAVLLLLAKL